MRPDATTPDIGGGSSMPHEREAACPLCGKLNPIGNRFCGNCGTKMPAAPPPVGAAGGGPALPSEPTMAMRAADLGAPPPSPPSTTAPAALPTDPIARERERERLLTLANVQRMRGQTKDAFATLTTVLTLMEGAAPRERAIVHEQMGDLMATQGNWEEAKKAFGEAKDADPSRAAAERKYAEASLRLAEVRMAASGAMAGGNLDAAGVVRRTKRNAGTAMLLSFFIPGLGQFANGQAVKGGLCLAVYVLTLLAMNLSPDGQVVYKQILAFTTGREVPGANVPVSPIFWMLLLLAFAVWVFSLIDAALVAGQMSRDAGDGGPVIDKSGWEV
jgi:Uncharacterized protein conserved in bacteria